MAESKVAGAKKRRRREPISAPPQRDSALTPAQRRVVIAIGSGPTFVDLFAGIGGFSLGFVQAGFRPLGGFDRDAEAVYQYAANLGAPSFLMDLMRRDAAAQVLKLVKERPRVVIGGPPCQGFSFIGKRDPADVRSALVQAFARIVITLRPDLFLMENVQGIFTMSGVHQRLRTILRAGGYSNADWITVNSANFGVPQRRKRAILVGSRRGAEWKLTDLVEAGSLPEITVGEALRGLPRARTKASLKDDAYVPYVRPALAMSYDESMRSPLGRASGMQQTKHTPEILEMMATLAPVAEHEATRYWRLDPSLPSRALRAGSRSRTATRPIHPTVDRVITVREAARLHSFPDWYEFSDLVALAHLQLGNSVPPRLAYALAKYTMSQLKDRSADTRKVKKRRRS